MKPIEEWFHARGWTPFDYQRRAWDAYIEGDSGLVKTRWREILTIDRLSDDLLACTNMTELARRQFRDIARIAGLVFPGFPGSGKTNRQLQASSSLFYDVFREYDAENLLLDQARREVLEEQLDVGRLLAALKRIEKTPLRLVPTQRLTPLAFPLWAEQLRSQSVSSERWIDRVRKMVVRLEKAAQGEGRKKPVASKLGK